MTKKGEALAWVENLPESEECQEFPFFKVDGYGRLNRNGSPVGAHRYSLILFSKKDPKDLFALHTCGNRACCNPKHLYWGSKEDNAQDSISDGTFAKGEKSGKSKLTEETVRAIFHAEGSLREIGRQFGISHRHVQMIKQKKRWKHIWK